jgi:hypothetical protein
VIRVSQFILLVPKELVESDVGSSHNDYFRFHDSKDVVTELIKLFQIDMLYHFNQSHNWLLLGLRTLESALRIVLIIFHWHFLLNLVSVVFLIVENRLVVVNWLWVSQVIVLIVHDRQLLKQNLTLQILVGETLSDTQLIEQSLNV